MAEIIEGILEKTGGKERSIRWFRQKVRELGDVPSATLVREGYVTGRPSYGKMNFFMYDPKFKDNTKVLPYYDMFPLVLPIEEYRDGFLGLNFHYLSIPMRLKLLNIIQEYASNDRMDESTTIRLTWNRIKRNPIVKPVVKRYLADHVRGTFRRIDAEEMMVAVLLPVQRFVRARETQVYADSRRIINQPRRV
jgi:hypothetical protein|tara:strand:+ start:126 stop:704 length:579 start_codon:yes stop_codon:yes gene_type:complete